MVLPPLPQIFTVLNCKPFADGTYRLVADLDVVCFEGAHTPYVVVAVIFICLYPVGVPLGLALVLRANNRVGDLYEAVKDEPGKVHATEEPKLASTKHLAGMYKK